MIATSALYDHVVLGPALHRDRKMFPELLNHSAPKYNSDILRHLTPFELQSALDDFSVPTVEILLSPASNHGSMMDLDSLPSVPVAEAAPINLPVKDTGLPSPGLANLLTRFRNDRSGYLRSRVRTLTILGFDRWNKLDKSISEFVYSGLLANFIRRLPNLSLVK